MILNKKGIEYCERGRILWEEVKKETIALCGEEYEDSLEMMYDDGRFLNTADDYVAFWTWYCSGSDNHSEILNDFLIRGVAPMETWRFGNGEMPFYKIMTLVLSLGDDLSELDRSDLNDYYKSFGKNYTANSSERV